VDHGTETEEAESMIASRQLLPLGLVACLAGVTEAAPKTQAPADDRGSAPPAEWGDYGVLLGAIRPRHAREIESSRWSVGAETMDRDFTIYRHWREYLGPLGAKRARVQSGWAKTEKRPGEYAWGWMDEIIHDMVKQDVRPWVCLCYGNPVYPRGGGTGLGGGLPRGEEALAGWERYVAAFVERYGAHVNEWEVWNEPRGASDEYYATLLVRTAEAIRRLQPEAVIIGPSTVRIDLKRIDGVLRCLKAQDRLHLLDQVCIHPYNENPDNSYPMIEILRDLIALYSDRITIRQGENGAPSVGGTFGALHQYDWSETKQAKWALRRLLGDLGHDIRPSSYFAICDMHYRGRKGTVLNTKGLLKTHPDQTVDRPKPSYAAVQHVTAVFDDRLKRIDPYPFYLEPWEKNDKRFSLSGYEDAQGRQALSVWRHTDAPETNAGIEKRDLYLPAGRFDEPVYVDMLSGDVREIPAKAWEKHEKRAVFKELPLYDSPVLIAERSLIPVTSRNR
jgi:hypothetical protein